MKFILAIALIVVGWCLVCRTDEKHPTLFQDCEGFVGAAMVLVGAVILLISFILFCVSKWPWM